MEDFEDYKIFFYILIAILYFLFSGKKKPKQVEKKQPPKQQEVLVDKPVSNIPKPQPPLRKKETSYQKPEEPRKAAEPFTLEDVLREFGNTLKEKPEVLKKTVEQEVLEDVKPIIVDYDENLEDEEEVASLEQKRGVLSTGKDEHFDPYLLDQKHENKYAAFLSNPDGLKTAFIAKEILDRKHF